jgi:hypothetical protein
MSKLSNNTNWMSDTIIAPRKPWGALAKLFFVGAVLIGSPVLVANPWMTENLWGFNFNRSFSVP